MTYKHLHLKKWNDKKQTGRKVVTCVKEKKLTSKMQKEYLQVSRFKKAVKGQWPHIMDK